MINLCYITGIDYLIHYEFKMNTPDWQPASKILLKIILIVKVSEVFFDTYYHSNDHLSH